MKLFFMVLLFPLLSFGYEVKAGLSDCKEVLLDFQGSLKKTNKSLNARFSSYEETRITEMVVQGVLSDYDSVTILSDRKRLTKQLKKEFDKNFAEYGYKVDELVLVNVVFRQDLNKVCPFKRK